MPRTTRPKKDLSDRRSLMVDKEDHARLRRVAVANGWAMGEATRHAIDLLEAQSERVESGGLWTTLSPGDMSPEELSAARRFVKDKLEGFCPRARSHPMSNPV